MGDDKKRMSADELKVVIDTVTTQNIYEGGCNQCRAERRFSGAITEMAAEDVSAFPVLGGGLLIRAGEALGYFSQLELCFGRLAKVGFRDSDLDEDCDE